MNTKQTLKLLLFLIITSAATAQQLYLETGKTSSSFDYKNSQGGKLDNLQATNHNFMILGYRDNLDSAEKLNVSFGIGYTGYGSIGSDDDLEGIMEWNVNCLELNAALDYCLFAINKTDFYLKGAISTGFLTQGTQILNNEIINLKNADDFDKTMVSFKAGAGFLHPVSRELSFYVQYLFGKSLNQSGNDDYESLRIKSHNISFGVLIDLFKS
ncbi:hypothetical protein [Confluentibacter sediminis]|uniref:hypothetical protein n=1 Tax=Confluentibacter sediminis TaxID=2219045 RepID=UPI000DAEA140|nr:hypothetical protein [Confluentibacter sediminis]